jgi:sterol desaturase/sphingolipid hydroxylase (fatty acid hydroxylase superfamily)
MAIDSGEKANDKELKRKRRELAEKVRGGTVHTAHTIQKRERRPGCLTFSFWMKAFTLLGVGSWSVMVFLLVLLILVAVIAGIWGITILYQIMEGVNQAIGS